MKFILTTTSLVFCTLFAVGQDWRSFQSEGRYGFKKDGAVSIQPEYDYAFDFSDGLALVKKGDKWGFIDEFNVPVVPFEFDRCSEFENGFAIVVRDGKFGIIDNSGNFSIPTECSHVKILRDGFSIGKNNGKFALFKGGARLSEYAYDDILPLSYGYFAFLQGDAYGVLEPNGRELIPAQFTSKPSCYGGNNPDDGHYFTGRLQQESERSFFSQSGELVMDGNAYNTRQVKYPYIYQGEKDGKITVVNVVTGEVLMPLTKTSINDQNWRPCDGFGYSSTDQIFYEMDSLVLMQSSKTPKNTAKLMLMPTIFEEFILALQANNLYSIYSHDVELLAKDVHVKMEPVNTHSPRVAICSIAERKLWMWKDGKFGKWNPSSTSIDFVSSAPLNSELLFNAAELNVLEPATFEALHHDDDNFLFTVKNGDKKFVYLFVDSGYLWEMDMVDADATIQFKKFEYDEYEEGGETFRQLYNVRLKIDGEKMDYEW